MKHVTTRTLIATMLLTVSPLVAHAQLIRCTSPDGKSSTLQRGKCASPTDIQTIPEVRSARPSSGPGSLDEAMAAYKARDFPKARKLLLPLANQGNATAQLLIGDMYHFGRGVPKDDAVAYSWNRKAAEQGDPKGQVLTGLMHEEGWGTPRDGAQAMAWYRKAADQGLASAQAALGIRYINGRNVPKDEAQGMQWMRKAAEGGESEAQALIGAAYLEGRAGLRKDKAQARFWLGKAAAQGDANARAALAQMDP